jgi:hypothetical protein
MFAMGENYPGAWQHSPKSKCPEPLLSPWNLCQIKQSSSKWKRRQAVDKTVADLNIEHYRRLLAVETDPVKRQTIERLLAEEETKLALAFAKKDETQNKT